MKTVRKLIIFLLIMATLLSNSVLAVSAAQISGDSEVDTYAYPGGDFSIVDLSGNIYSTRTWSSLNEAKAYYGMNLTYFDCYQIYGGSIYNYFYNYSDGTKLYFYVGY